MIPSCANEKEGEKHGGTHARVVAIEGKEGLLRIPCIRHFHVKGMNCNNNNRLKMNNEQIK